MFFPPTSRGELGEQIQVEVADLSSSNKMGCGRSHLLFFFRGSHKVMCLTIRHVYCSWKAWFSIKILLMFFLDLIVL